MIPDKLDAALRAIERDSPNDVGRLVTMCASYVLAQRTEWFCSGRIPFGAVTLLDGAGGVGKTAALMGIIAAASVGRSFFDGSAVEPTTALVVVEEDSVGLLKMRLQVAGADLDRGHFVAGVRVENSVVPFTIPAHVADLEDEIRRRGARLVYIDALFSHLELDGEGRMPQQVRRALRPLIEMVGRTGIAFVATRHWTKAPGIASSRALGSVELGNIARSVLTFGANPEGHARGVIAVGKHNLAAQAPSLAYRIENVTAEDDDGHPCDVTRVVLDGECDVSVDDLAMRVPSDPDERGAAEDWLQDCLADGEPHPSANIYAAARRDGIGSPATLKRAARRLGMVMDRVGFAIKGGAQSTWSLPLGSRSAHSESVSRPDENDAVNAQKGLVLQRSVHDLPLGSRPQEGLGCEPSADVPVAGESAEVTDAW